MKVQPATSGLFLVRVWSEKNEDGQEEWRGKVQHVLSGKALPFRGWLGLEADLVEMLQGASSMAEDPANHREEEKGVD